MKPQRITTAFAVSAFGLGFVSIYYGFEQMITRGGLIILLQAVGHISLGLSLIFLSAKADMLLRLVPAVSRTVIGNGRRMMYLLFLLLFSLSPLFAQEAPSLGVKMNSLEVGSTLVTDSDSEQFSSYFSLFKMRVAGVDDVKLWIRQSRKQDRFGDQSLLDFWVENSPVRWLSFKVGYQQMPIASVRLGKNLGRLHVAVGATREAIISRSNALNDRIDHRSAYLDVSYNLTDRINFGVSASRGRFGDGNYLTIKNGKVSYSNQFNKLRFLLTTGYSDRLLDRYSIYYWSPEVYREVYIAPDFGLVFDSFWIYVNFSADRILEERYTGSDKGTQSWAANGEISSGYRIGPGSIYVTLRFWNSGVQRPNEAYSGRIMQVSYELFMP